MSISFKAPLIPEVFNGGKTVTRRSKSSNYEKGQEHAIVPGMGREQIGRLRILDVSFVRLGDIDEADAVAEGFQDLTAFRVFWQEMHKEWLPDLIVKRIEFEVIEQTHRLCGCCDGAGVTPIAMVGADHPESYS